MTEQDQRPVKGYPDSMGPDIHSGGEQEPGGPVPPYEGRKTDTPRQEAEAMHSVHSVDESVEAPRREISDTEAQGVPPTDTSAASPLGAGVTRGNQGNEQALKMSEEQQQKERMEHGISRSKPIDPNSPDIPVGDQGG